MADMELRIVSLIPSATEILAQLGLTHQIVGRSHECDYPAEIRTRPICTEPKFNPEGTSAEIHERVTDLLQSALSVYRVKTEVLEQLKPTHILTQAQCEVCAVNLADVEQAVATLTQTQPQIISLQPNTLKDIWDDIRRVAIALGIESQSSLTQLQARVEACATKTQALSDRPTVACIEWAEPLMAAGNWIPELVELAGGQSLFGVVGQHSPWLQWDALVAADPEVIILMPCGYDLERTHQDAIALAKHPEWPTLRAVQAGNVYITDGNQYFNRPGPRLVDSLEILAEILHPHLFNFGYEDTGWQRLPAQVKVN
ncbi:cobalamin-binding protein [Trichocoleus sp. FACHB-591]|uniref:cobalamin-binding protein n=1 Tax=Trichocoleus sp. FACHB-591 TaxID=2692872 RepID=UPI00168724C0|nr:cobalamin-binding protein [Trichocoleus sp. FACHB-591]MBD2098724.1 cobalamin-binding protein [Trichocoleus sp. FACHB-591]